jgi:DNA repair protein RadC
VDKTDWQKKGAGHRQRLRDKFLELGLSGLTDSEVLELLLTLGTPRKDCKDLARAILKQFGTLAGALEASGAELQLLPGVGPKNAFALHFIHAVARRYLKQRLNQKDYLRSSSEVGDYLVHAMRDLKREVFLVILLDASHAIIDCLQISEGTLNRNTVHPREVIKLALDHHAAAMVVAHNHPSGALEPSREDRLLTRSLFLALAFAGVQLLDHLIVGMAGRPFSFADHGLMENLRQECLPLIKGT